jgi:hypothetical protein
MTNQLLPPPELDHPLPDNLSQEQLASLWIECLEIGEAFLLAGIRSSLPPGGDEREISRELYEDYCQEHLQMLQRMAERFNQVQDCYGSSCRPPDA